MGAVDPARYLRCDRLITGAGDAPISDAALLVRGGRLVAVGSRREVPVPPDAEVVDYAGCTVLPGLIDAHVHLAYRKGEAPLEHHRRFDDHQLLERSAHHARQMLESGVTTVRDCGSRGTFMQALRDGIATGALPGPRLLVCGPPLTTPGGHLWMAGGAVGSVDEARALVQRLVQEGVDFIKVMATGGWATPGSHPGRAQFTADALQAIVQEAHLLGKLVAAHCRGTAGILAAVAAGVDIVEHGNWEDADAQGFAFDEAVARRMAERGIWRNMTMQPRRGVVEKVTGQPLTADERAWLAAAEQLWRWFHAGIALGVPSFLSTDAACGEWEDSAPDLPWLAVLMRERGGLAMPDVLRMITALPARAIGLGDQVGTLAPGRLADLLVVRGDPLTSPRALLDVVAVYRSGRQVVFGGT